MSEVYRAIDSEGDHGDVVVKLLPKSKENNKWMVLSFELEVSARLAPLDHPNIVPLIDRGRDPESKETYLVFPWAGNPLSEVLKVRGSLSWDEWWTEFGRPILDALAHAHSQDVAHRDVKPDNILIDDYEIPRLGDFGVSKLMREMSLGLTLNEHVSRPFAPPDIDDGIHSRTRDLHAWAALTYFAICGINPEPVQPGEDPYKQLSEAALQGSSLIDERINQLLVTCLDLKPQKRPQVASDLLSRLDEICLSAPEGRTEPACLHIRVSPSVLRDLEEAYDLLSADSHDLVLRNLSDVVVLSTHKADEYRMVGSELSMHVKVSSNGDCLRLLRVVRSSSEQLERDRDRGWPAEFDFRLGEPDDPVLAANAVGLLSDEVQAHDDAEKLAFQRRQKLKPITMWRSVLRALREAQRDLEDPLPYEDVRRTAQSQNRVFTLRPGRSGRHTVGQSRIAPAEGDHSFSGEVLNASDRELVIKPDPRSSEDVLESADLTFNTRPAETALRRQETALEGVIRGRALRSDLVSLLAEPASAKRPRRVREPKARQDLDGDKRSALLAALGEPDLMAVKGPPGTGKTRLIAEIVYQELHRNPDFRILVASQTHAGLDNALTRIRSLDSTFRLLRIARRSDERVDESVSEIRMDEQLESWGDEARRSGTAWLRTWAGSNGLDLKAIRDSMLLEELSEGIRELNAADVEASRIGALLDDERSQRKSLGSTPEGTEAIRSLTADLEESKEELRTQSTRARTLLRQLVESGEFADRTRVKDLDPEVLKSRASTLATNSAEEKKCRELIEVLDLWHLRFGTTPEFQAAAIARAQVVGATCVGLASIKGLETIPFDLCIIDEASRATAPELIIPMSRSRRFILVGDEKQLPPYLDMGELNSDVLEKFGLSEGEITKPYFSFACDSLSETSVLQLTEQHRMCPAIGDLVSECFYEGQLKSVGGGFRLKDALEDVAPRPVVWFSTDRLKSHNEHRSGESLANDAEAAVVKSLVERLEMMASKHGLKVSLAVLSGYRGQCRTIESRLATQIANSSALSVGVHTIDSFQGREADVVIYSVTRSNPKGRQGFLKERPRLNVALSRAREALFVVGDPVSVRKSQGENPLLDVLEYVEANPETCQLLDAPDDA